MTLALYNMDANSGLLSVSLPLERHIREGSVQSLKPVTMTAGIESERERDSLIKANHGHFGLAVYALHASPELCVEIVPGKGTILSGLD